MVKVCHITLLVKCKLTRIHLPLWLNTTLKLQNMSNHLAVGYSVTGLLCFSKTELYAVNKMSCYALYLDIPLKPYVVIGWGFSEVLVSVMLGLRM